MKNLVDKALTQVGGRSPTRVMGPGPENPQAGLGGRGTGEPDRGRRSLAESAGQGLAKSTWFFLMGGDARKTGLKILTRDRGDR
jgi:hypothetical protein